MDENHSVRFVPYVGDTGDLVRDDNYLIFRWAEPDCMVLFSVCKRGEAANIHFDCDKAGAKRIKEALGEFCDFVFWIFDWCTMVMGIIAKPSVQKMVQKCGFSHVADINNSKVYVRPKDGILS